LEEEREKEQEELLQKSIITQKIKDLKIATGKDPIKDLVVSNNISLNNSNTITMADRIIEAIDMYLEDQINIQNNNKQGIPLLKAIGKDAETHLYDTLASTKAGQLENTLSFVPYSKLITLLKLIENWFQSPNRDFVVCFRILNYIVFTYRKQLNTITDSSITSTLINLKEVSKTKIAQTRVIINLK
jgi:hypothetical protein